MILVLMRWALSLRKYSASRMIRGGAGWPGFTNLMKDGNARFIAPSAEEIARIRAKEAAQGGLSEGQLATVARNDR